MQLVGCRRGRREVGEPAQRVLHDSRPHAPPGHQGGGGHRQRPDADAKALRHGWYFTGDTGYVDAAGDLFVTGRVDDLIISGGENISPAEIESVLSLHPAVAEVAVAGLPDERWVSASPPS